MSDTTDRNSEIDLIVIFSKLKLWIISIGSFVNHVVLVAIRKWVTLLIFVLMGGGIGIGYFFIVKPTYISTVILTSNILSNDFCSDIVNDMELLIKDNSPQLLADRLKMDSLDASQIIKLEFENYDENLKKIYKDKDTIVLGRPFKIIASVESPTIFPAIQKGLIQYLENNSYAVKRKQIKKNNLSSMQEKLKGEIHQLDSLKLVVTSNLLPRGNSNGFVFGQPIDPINVYKEGIRLYQNELSLNEELELIDSIQVIKDFAPRNKPDSPKLKWNIFFGGLIAFFIGLIRVLYKENKQSV